MSIQALTVHSINRHINNSLFLTHCATIFINIPVILIIAPIRKTNSLRTFFYSMTKFLAMSTKQFSIFFSFPILSFKNNPLLLLSMSNTSNTIIIRNHPTIRLLVFQLKKLDNMLCLLKEVILWTKSDF